jgi:hypothetical protein
MARQPNVVKESGSRLVNEDSQRPIEDRQNFYSRTNPNGPYQRYRERPYGMQGQEFIEGFSTRKNVDAWSNYASRNSGPKIAPGLGSKSRGR